MFSSSPAVATQQSLMEDSERTPLLWDPESLSYRNASGSYSRFQPNQFSAFAIQRADTLQPLPPPPPPPLPPPEFFKQKDDSRHNAHAQFCALTGCPPSDLAPGKKFNIPSKSLYGRTISQLSSQRRAYNFSASLNNILLLSQVILGAALTALGASASSHILITIFGASNTIIAGVIAYLKSRAQPMRARMYRDDLERIVDEIENSEVMWRGISEGAHGYSDIDTDEITVRSEVARLTRLYDRAIRLNGMNNPDMYMGGSAAFDGNSGGANRSNRPIGGMVAVPAAAPATTAQPSGGADQTTDNVPAEDAAPATKVAVKDKGKDKDKDSDKDADKPKQDDPSAKQPDTDGATDDKGKATADQDTSKPVETKPAAPAPAPSAPTVNINTTDDPDSSPATAANIKLKKSKDKQKDVSGIDGQGAGDGKGS